MSERVHPAWGPLFAASQDAGQSESQEELSQGDSPMESYLLEASLQPRV